MGRDRSFENGFHLGSCAWRKRPDRTEKRKPGEEGYGGGIRDKDLGSKLKVRLNLATKGSLRSEILQFMKRTVEKIRGINLKRKFGLKYFPG